MSELNINEITLHMDVINMFPFTTQIHHLMSLMIKKKSSELAKFKTDGQKCTIYYPQVLRWMFEQKGRFSFQVKGTQIESINNVLDVSEPTGVGTKTQGMLS